jgi:4'-phosphopantetheinyl transferase
MNICDRAFRVDTPLALPDNEVHLWRLDIRAAAPVPMPAAEDRWADLLSPEEKLRAERFIAPMARQHFVATRGLLRMLLGGYLAADLKTIAFRFSTKEKPGLSSPYAESKIEFNVSHSGGVALLAFTRGREIGVDVEQVRQGRDVDAIARRFFSLEEQKQFASVAAEEKYDAFSRCWTRKEAYIKAKGDGLSLPLGQFDVSLQAGASDALRATRPDAAEAKRWSLCEVPAGAGYIGALCVAGHGWLLRGWSE